MRTRQTVATSQETPCVSYGHFPCRDSLIEAVRACLLPVSSNQSSHHKSVRPETYALGVWPPPLLSLARMIVYALAAVAALFSSPPGAGCNVSRENPVGLALLGVAH